MPSRAVRNGSGVCVEAGMATCAYIYMSILSVTLACAARAEDYNLVQCLTETAASVGRASVPAEAGRDAGPTSRVPQLL
jgi:hypothetical protein